MYIDSLLTPHPSLAGIDGTRPLVDVIGGEPLSAVAPTERIQRAARAMIHVGAALRYPDRRNTSLFGPDESTLHTLRLQITNCIGYTIVGSEALRDDHYVVYGNQHGFLGVTDENGRLHSVDALSPHLDGDISGATDRNTQQIDEEIATRGRAVTLVNAHVFARAGRNYDMLADDHPWLSAGNPASNQHSYRGRDGIGRDSTLVLSIYDGPTGRQVLESYVNFKHDLMMGRPVAAAHHLAQISGLYPEVDARAKHVEIKTLVRNLCKLGEFSLAKQSVDSYCRSFDGVSDDPRLHALEAELLARVANASGNREIADEAADLYEAAARRSKSSWAPTAWRTKAGRLRNAA